MKTSIILLILFMLVSMGITITNIQETVDRIEYQQLQIHRQLDNELMPD